MFPFFPSWNEHHHNHNLKRSCTYVHMFTATVIHLTGNTTLLVNDHVFIFLQREETLNPSPISSDNWHSRQDDFYCYFFIRIFSSCTDQLMTLLYWVLSVLEFVPGYVTIYGFTLKAEKASLPKMTEKVPSSKSFVWMDRNTTVEFWNEFLHFILNLLANQINSLLPLRNRSKHDCVHKTQYLWLQIFPRGENIILYFHEWIW